MSDPFLGEIRLVPYNFAPRDYAFCNGQVMPISQNSALFSLLGTNFGGDGQTTFALPDLRGRSPVHSGNAVGPGLSPILLGQSGGAETTTLTVNNLPSHNHVAGGTQTAATASRPAGNVPSAGGAYAAAPDGNPMHASFIGNTGSNQPFELRSPYLGLNYVIALAGLFPSRN